VHSDRFDRLWPLFARRFVAAIDCREWSGDVPHPLSAQVKEFRRQRPRTAAAAPAAGRAAHSRTVHRSLPGNVGWGESRAPGLRRAPRGRLARAALGAGHW